MSEKIERYFKRDGSTSVGDSRGLVDDAIPAKGIDISFDIGGKSSGEKRGELHICKGREGDKDSEVPETSYGEQMAPSKTDPPLQSRASNHEDSLRYVGHINLLPLLFFPRQSQRYFHTVENVESREKANQGV